jgi:regulator of cell morphogenesis and NO signaling
MPTIDVPPVDLDRTLGDLVTERPARARVLERAGIDYCCKGHRSLAEASEVAGVDAAALAAELAAVDDDAGVEVDRLDPIGLIEHILATHHAYLHEELPLLDALAAKVEGVHAGRHPELHQVARLVRELRADLEPHLAKEEQVLFPAIRAVGGDTGEAPAGPLTAPIAVMRAEHDRAGELLEELRRTTRSYAVPDDGCASYRSLYERLEQLEADTHRHVHLENNVLFPAVA